MSELKEAPIETTSGIKFEEPSSRENIIDNVSLVPCMSRQFSLLLRWKSVFMVEPVTLAQKFTARHSSWIQLEEKASMCESSTKLIPYRLITLKFGVADLSLCTFITS